MRDTIVLVYVGFIFFAAVFFASISIVHLFRNKKIRFDKGFGLSLSACCIAVMLCFSIWPPVHRVYDDEMTYITQSVNILSFGKPGIILKGSRLHSEVRAPWTVNPKLPGFAWLEAIVLFLTRDFGQSYFILNIILGALSVALVYRIAWLLTASHAVAWWSAIFLASLPARITYSMSAASDIAGFFFFLLFLLFICEYRGLKARRILYAALFCGVYSICIKPFYGVFVILGLAAALYIYRRDGLLDKKACKQILLDTACLFFPILSAIPVFLLSDSKAGAYSFSFIVNNFYTSISYLFNDEQNTVLTSVAALAAIGWSIFYKKDILVNGLAGWFLTVFLMFLVFYSGGISYPGHAYSDRYFLFLAFPFVLLAAKGMVDIIRWMGSPFWGILFLMVLVVNAFFASNHLNNEAKDSFYYQKTLLLKQVFQSVPNEAYILDGDAALITTISSKKSIQMSLFLDGNHPEEVVVLKGMADDLYDSDDPKRMVLVENILNTKYSCKPLTTAPLKEASLSATPFLCVRKND
jgi:hypothetical protein